MGDRQGSIRKICKRVGWVMLQRDLYSLGSAAVGALLGRVEMY